MAEEEELVSVMRRVSRELEEAPRKRHKRDLWLQLLATAAADVRSARAPLLGWSCDTLAHAGADAGEAFWTVDAVEVAWNALVFCVVGPEQRDVLVAAAAALAQHARADGGPVGLRRTASRLVREWPVDAFAALVRHAHAPLHPFVEALDAAPAELVARECVGAWVDQRDWALLWNVLRFAPRVTAASLCLAGRLHDAPPLPTEAYDAVAAALNAHLTAEATALLCTSGRPDASALRERVTRVMLPATAEELSQLWLQCASDGARDWLLRGLHAWRVTPAFLARVVIAECRCFEHARPRQLLHWAWHALNPTALSGAVAEALGEPRSVAAVLEALHAMLQGGDAVHNAGVAWPLGTMLREGAAADLAVRVIALESPLVVRSVGTAVFRVLIGRGAAAPAPTWLAPVVLAVADADAVTRNSFVHSLFSVLLSDAATGFWRVRRTGTAAPRADALTLDWADQESPAVSTAPWALDAEAALGTRVSLLAWNSQRRVVGVTEANRHFHHAVGAAATAASSGRAAATSEAVVMGHCAALGQALLVACRDSRHVGLALDLAQALDACAVLESLHQPPFDWEVYAATLPRQGGRLTGDVFVDALFAQNPLLWDVLEAVATVPLAMAHCHRVVAALLCRLVGSWYAQRARARVEPADLRTSRRLLAILRATQGLPPPLCDVDVLFDCVPPQEGAALLLSCWRFYHRFPPRAEEFANCVHRRFATAALAALPDLMQPARVSIAAHLADLEPHMWTTLLSHAQ